MADSAPVSGPWQDPEEAAELTDLETQLMAICRSRCTTEEMMTDIECIRMARKAAKEKNPEKFLNKCMGNWEKNYKVLRIPSDKTFDNETELRENYPWYAFGQDKQGHLVCYGIAEDVNLKMIGKNMDVAMEYVARFLSRITEFNAQQSETRGKRLYQSTWVIECKNVGWMKILKNLGVFRRLINRIRGTVPEMISNLYVFNPPKGLDTILKIVNLSEGAKAKLNLIHSSDYSVLDDHVDPSQRPAFWKGTSNIDPQIGNIQII